MKLTAARLKQIPHQPGVYTFTRREVPIYIGKAADLRHRLAAYRTDAKSKGDGRPWIGRMTNEATGLRVELTDSEIEALLLEANRIKARQPKYNTANRDQKNFLHIAISDEEFPQVLATRNFASSGAYFGPFTSAYAVRETLRALRKIFPYRCKNKPIMPERRDGVYSRPQRADVKSAPAIRIAKPCLYFHLGQCAGTCAGMITPEQYRRRVIAPFLRLLEGKTITARRQLDHAHRMLLDEVLAHTRVLSVTEKYANDLREVQRALRLPTPPQRIEGYDVSNIHGIAAVGSMVVAINGEPEPSEYKRFKIRTLEGRPNDVGMLMEVLERRLDHAPASLRGASQPLAASAAWRDVAIPSARTPMVGIASVAQLPRNDKNIWPDPNLILIDGGKPQLNAALRVMRHIGVAFPVVALAKRAEEIYLPGQKNPLRLPKNAPALHLLQRIRDEAHRFAIGYHLFRRTKRMFY